MPFRRQNIAILAATLTRKKAFLLTFIRAWSLLWYPQEEDLP